MKKINHVLWETLLVLASVLVFRSLWLMIDKMPLFSETYVLLISLIAGLIIGGIAYYRMAHMK